MKMVIWKVTSYYSSQMHLKDIYNICFWNRIEVESKKNCYGLRVSKQLPNDTSSR